MMRIDSAYAPLVFEGLILVAAFVFLGGFLLAWRRHQFDNLEFTKYKVFNDCGPDEPQPSPWTRREREPHPVWIPIVAGLMLVWLGLLVFVFRHFAIQGFF